MRLYKAFILGLISIAPAACLVVPVRSTYYEPNAMDGTPERSDPASKRMDTVGRLVDGVYIQAHADSNAGQNLIVAIRINCHDQSVEVNPNLIELQAIADGKTFQAQSVMNQDLHGEQSNRSNYWISLRFPDTAAAEKIAIVFAPGSVRKDGRNLSLQPFRFARVTKWNARVY